MDKTKMSVAITASLLCTMLYTNVSSTRADMRIQDTDTIALAYVAAAPIAPGTLSNNQRARDRLETAATSAALPAVESADPRFAEYLKLHQSRMETPPPAPLKLAASR